MNLAVALAKHKEFEQHKLRVKQIKPNIKAEENLTQYEEVNNGFITKKKLRDTFKTREFEDEIQAAHQRLLRHFVDIDKGKQLSVGPSTNTLKISHLSPVSEMHSLNFTSKKREFARIDHENEKLLKKLSATQTSV